MVNKNVELALNSLACEMESLKSIVVNISEINYEDMIVHFECRNVTVAMFLSGMCSQFDADILLTSNKDRYKLRISNGYKIMDLASTIDATKCDAPNMYK